MSLEDDLIKQIEDLTKVVKEQQADLLRLSDLPSGIGTVVNLTELCLVRSIICAEGVRNNPVVSAILVRACHEPCSGIFDHSGGDL